MATTAPGSGDGSVGPRNFEKLRLLGSGSTGRVYLVRSVGLGADKYYAMKVVRKSELQRRDRVKRIHAERQILAKTSHPFVVGLHYSFETDEFYYLVMQYCAGGDLFSFLGAQATGRLVEAHARFYAAEVLIALEYLHVLGIIYRDLKPENLLLHETGHLVISDFDLAHDIHAQPTAAASDDGEDDDAVDARTSNRHHRRATPPPRKHSAGSPTRFGRLGRPPPPPPLSPTIVTTDSGIWDRVPSPRITRAVTVDAGEFARPPTAVADPIARSRPRRWRRRLRRVSLPQCLRGPYPILDPETHMELMIKRTSFVGTHEYVAPEIISDEGYVGSVDWWAFGVLLYEMIYGVTPFRGATPVETLERILDISEEIVFPPAVDVSEECKDLMRRLLAKDPTQRLRHPLLIKSHAFFKDTVWPLVRHQDPPIVPPMVHALQDRTHTQEQIDAFDDEVPFHRALSNPNSPKRSTQQPHHLAGTKSLDFSRSRPIDASAPVSAQHVQLTDVGNALCRDFTYTSGMGRDHWVSMDSHRSLTEKLAQLDLSVEDPCELRSCEQTD